jgi:hypothetical protein
MGFLKDGSQVSDVDLGVDGGGVDGDVAEELLDVADAGAALKKMGRTRSSKRVGMNGLVDAGSLGVLSQHEHDEARADSIAGASEEERRFCRVINKEETSLLEIAKRGFGGLCGYRNETILFTFAIAHEKRSRLKVDVAEVQAHAFTATDGGSVQKLEDRAITKAAR